MGERESSPMVSLSCSHVLRRGRASSSAFVGIPLMSCDGGYSLGPGMFGLQRSKATSVDKETDDTVTKNTLTWNCITSIGVQARSRS